MRIPEPGHFGDTFLDANVLAMVFASRVKSPSGGYVETVVTVLIHRFADPLLFFLIHSSFFALIMFRRADLPDRFHRWRILTYASSVLSVILERLNFAARCNSATRERHLFSWIRDCLARTPRPRNS